MKIAMTVIAASLALSACSMTNLTTRQYDPVEYNYAINIVVDSTHAVHRCGGPVNEFNIFAQQINLNSAALEEFVANKKDTEQTLVPAQQIRDMNNDLLSRDNASVAYCRHKLSNIQASARTFARATASSDKFDFCQSDLQSRYDLFAASLKKNAISKDEFTDLVTDLTRLKDIDTAACSLEKRTQMENAISKIQFAAKILTAL